MRHRKHTFKIGRRSAHVRSLLANQVCSLIQHGRIETTLVKAKETRRFAEQMITLGKKGTLHHRRQAIAFLKQVDTVGTLFSDIAPRFAERVGGYTRIIKLGPRRGDATEMCFLELVEAGAPAKKAPSKKKKASASAPAEAAAPAETAPAAE